MSNKNNNLELKIKKIIKSNLKLYFSYKINHFIKQLVATLVGLAIFSAYNTYMIISIIKIMEVHNATGLQ